MRFLLLLCFMPALASGAIEFFERFINCKQLGNGLYPNPVNKCSVIYFACVGGKLDKLHCDTGLAFNKISKLCQTMRQVPDCASSLPPINNNPPPPPPLPSFPQPKPLPLPQPQPLPFPQPKPLPFPQPNPLPFPQPNNPLPFPQPKPLPFPQPNNPLPFPQPKPLPFPQPQPLPFPQPNNNPLPFPQPQPQPLPFPNKQFPRQQQPFIPQQPFIQKPIRPSVNFNCQGKQDGDYAKGCSNIYYSCSGGEAFERNCPRKALKYDSRKKQCDLKEYVSDCGGRPRVIPKTTPGPVVRDNGLCRSRKDGVYPNPKSKCSHLFLTCSGGFGRMGKCQHTFKFDVATGQCMSGLHIASCGGTPTTPNPLVTPFPVQSDPSYQCQGKLDGDYPHPRQKCSHLFFSCVAGTPVPRSCGSKFLAFDGKKCENRAHARICGGSPIPPTLKPKFKPVPKPDFNCQGLPDGLHASRRQNGCSGTFYSCNNGFVAELHCYKNLFFDKQSQRCIQKAYISACGGRPTPPQKELPPIKADVAFDCEKHGQGSHSRGCSHEYVVCDSGRAILMKCPAALKFDKATNSCEAKQYIRECGGKPRPVTKAPQLNPAPKVNFNCGGKPDGQYKDIRQRCAPHFYICSSEIASLVKCPSGMFYDSTIKACNFKQHTPDCGGKPPTPYVPPPKQVVNNPIPILNPIQPVAPQRIDPKEKFSQLTPVILPPQRPQFQPQPQFQPRPQFQPQRPQFQPQQQRFNDGY